MTGSAFAASAFIDLFRVPEGVSYAPLILLTATLLYVAYHLVIQKDLVIRLFPGQASEEELRTTVSFFRKAAGAVLLGLVPAIPAALFLPGGLEACGLSLRDAPRSLLLAAGFVALSSPLLVLQAKKPAFRQHYPEVRLPFSARIAARNALAWAAFLLAYELFFRGFLVLGLAPHLGRLPALAVSLMGYVFVHLGKYTGELLGTFVSGTVFGLVALETGSILGPFLAHLGVALLTDTLASRPAGRPHA
jgi:membrane protease YdiL (CAAX protease family)